MRAWLTRDSEPGEQCVSLRLPADPGWRADLLGAILLLADPRNWEQSGSKTPDEMSNAWRDFFWEIPPWKGCYMVGEIRAYAGSGAAPAGWLTCDGTQLNITDYPDLYAAIGTSWGSGSGTFALPDLRGRSPIGAGQAPGLTNRTLAAIGGEESHSLTIDEMPSHNHFWRSGLITPYPKAGTTTTNIYQYYPMSITGAPPASQNDTTINGGSQQHNNMPPFAVVNWLIRALP